MPFEELPHTADWCLRVWAEDLPHLFVDSAGGMNALAGISLMEGPTFNRSFNLTAPDAESLLVAFLSELLYFSEHDHLAFDRYALTLSEDTGLPITLSATVEGAPIRSITKNIKAVTFHNLHILRNPDRCEVEIVLDI